MDVIAAGATITAVMGAMLALVRIAIAAERRRADDWRETARTRGEANAVLSANNEKLIGSIEQVSLSNREIMATLQQVLVAVDRQRLRDVA
jgi:membrane glycosyltransferase